MYALLGVKKSVSNHCHRRNVYGVYTEIAIIVHSPYSMSDKRVHATIKFNLFENHANKQKILLFTLLRYPTQYVCAHQKV